MVDGGADTDAGPSYCPNCGNELRPPGIYCSQCGTKVRRTEPARVHDGTREDDAEGPAKDDAEGPAKDDAESAEEDDAYGETVSEFRDRVQRKVMQGWEIEHDAGDGVVLVDRDYGSMGTHILLGIFTGGIGNLVYFLYKYSDSEQIVLRRGERTTSGHGTAPAPVEAGDDGPALTSTFGGFALLLVGLAAIASSGLSLEAIVFGVFLVTLGAYIMPQIRRRLADRHPVATFGRTKSTEEAVVTDPDAPCSACMSPIDSGVKRTYTEEQVAAGVPLYTVESGSNHYCSDCATGTSTDIDEELAGDRERSEEFDLETN
jgi:hypothetical protein